MSKITASVIILLLAASVAQADLQRSVLRHGAEGTSLRVEQAPGEGSAVNPPLRDDIVAWERHIPGLIYTSCGIAPDSYYGGTSNGDPAAVENLGNDGSPNWIWSGGVNSVHRGAVGEYDEPAGSVNVRYGGDGESWAWTTTIADCTLPARCVRNSGDGSVVAVAVNVGGDHAEVHCLDAGDGSTISTFVAPSGQYARALRITDDGGLVALRAGATLYAIDVATGASLWTGSAGASADPLGFSPDGRWLCSGWTFLYVWERVGDSYQFRFSYNGGGSSWYLGTCAVNDGGDLIAAYYRNDWRQTKVQMVDANAGGEGDIWLGAESNGFYQELPSASFIDNDPSPLAVVGNWGDATGQSPEILICQYPGAEPVATLDTPGSVYDLDAASISLGRSSGLEIVACGKAVHANEFGSGGDYFNLYYASTGVPAGPAADRLALAAHPNPFNPATTLRVTLAEPGPLSVEIFDAQGRALRRLDAGFRPEGSAELRWDGRDDAGRPLPSGLYLARAASGGELASVRLMLLK